MGRSATEATSPLSPQSPGLALHQPERLGEVGLSISLIKIGQGPCGSELERIAVVARQLTDLLGHKRVLQFLVANGQEIHMEGLGAIHRENADSLATPQCGHAKTHECIELSRV